MRMLIVNPIAGCGYALKVMEQVQSVLTARNLPFRVMRTEYPGCARIGGQRHSDWADSGRHGQRLCQDARHAERADGGARFHPQPRAAPVRRD